MSGDVDELVLKTEELRQHNRQLAERMQNKPAYTGMDLVDRSQWDAVPRNDQDQPGTTEQAPHPAGAERPSVASDGSDGALLTPQAVADFNDLFAGHVGVFVDAEGVTTFRTWDTEIKIKDGVVVGKTRCQGSRMTVPGWLDICKNPNLGELIPWSDAECEQVRSAIRQCREQVKAA